MIYFWSIISLETPVLCFHYWDFLMNFWRNNWRSIIDVVKRLCLTDNFQVTLKANSDDDFPDEGAKYLCFFSSRSLKTREKYKRSPIIRTSLKRTNAEFLGNFKQFRFKHHIKEFKNHQGSEFQSEERKKVKKMSIFLWILWI